MQSFFKASAVKNKMSNHHISILLLLNDLPRFAGRSFSSAASLTAPVIRNVMFDLQREEALKRHGFSNLRLMWPKKTRRAKYANYITTNPRSIKQMYGESDLSKLPIFRGGFINFGYWPNPLLNNEAITEERILK
jgi:hypothetical protein